MLVDANSQNLFKHGQKKIPITFAFDVVHWQVDLGNTAIGCFGRETHSKSSQ
jgi:hypothetical protein